MKLRPLPRTALVQLAIADPRFGRALMKHKCDNCRHYDPTGGDDGYCKKLHVSFANRDVEDAVARRCGE